MVKYPLLLKQVLKFSNANAEHAGDMGNLTVAIDILESVIREVDTAMAEARAQFTVSRLEWLDEAVEAKSLGVVRNAREEIISGTLRNNRGTKLECYLLDTVLILGRPSSRMSVVMAASSTTSLSSAYSSTSSLASTASTSSNHSSGSHNNANTVRPPTKKLQVYRTPIPTAELMIEDLNPTMMNGSFNEGAGGTSQKHGSFKSAFSGSSQTGNDYSTFGSMEYLTACFFRTQWI